MSKHKPTQHQKQAEKERINRNNKEYMKGLDAFLVKLNLKQHFNLISTQSIKKLITTRISSIRLIPCEPKDYNAELEKRMMFFFKSIIEKEEHLCFNNEYTISFREYFIYMVSLTVTLKNQLKTKNNDRLREAFGEMLAFVEEKHTDIVTDMCSRFKVLSVCLSDAIDGYFQFGDFDIQDKNSKERKATSSWCSSIYATYKKTTPPSRHIFIEEKKREVIEMAHINWDGQLTWCTVMPSMLKRDGETPIPVFIQKHAIHRTWERLDIILNEMHHFVISQSIIEAKNIKNIGSDRYLIPTYFNSQKLGYMIANYSSNVLVITTFLFITQEGTPEGILLSKLTGFKKFDKSYLCIDKLSTFIESDIASKPELVKLLQEANLGHLVDLHREIGYICNAKNENRNDPSFILEYIHKKKEEDLLSQTEMQEQEQEQESETMVIP